MSDFGVDQGWVLVVILEDRGILDEKILIGFT